MIKLISKSAIFVGLITCLGTQAFAQSSYVTPFNTALATSGFSCNACHDATVFSVKLPIAADRLKPNLTGLDSDGDGASNGIETRMQTDFNVNTSLPSGAASAATSATADDVVFVGTASSVTTAVATDLAAETNNTFTLSGSDIIIGGVSITPTLASAGSIELGFEAFGITTAKVYEVVGGVATELTPVTVNTKGSITFTTTDAQPKLLIVGASGIGSGSSTGGDASVTGCITGSTSTPLMMFLAMLALGFFVGRKK